VLQDQDGPVYFAPLTYCEPLTASVLSGEKKPTHDAALAWQIEQMLAQIPAQSRKVAISHAFVAGATPTPDSERPLAVGGTTTVDINNFAPFNYTALGHLHAAQSCSPTVRYCGSLLKYSFAEATQKKAVQLVDLDSKGQTKVETIALSQPHDLIRLRGSFQELLAKDPADFASAYMQLTLTDTMPILDAKHKLEQVYPQILELTYERLAISQKELSVEEAQKKKLTPYELFANFFHTINDRDLSDKEAELLRQSLTQLEDEGRRS
jgi:exonuclease SbcD